MRPLRLIMTAFGPYKERQVIDFAELEDHRLFVISGNTGAGKTMIFDAICYALYGQASGEDREDVRMLRSHFADDETYTSVDLQFQIGKKTYRVFRQMKHRKAGNKSETGDKIELYELKEGKEIACVDRFRVSDVNQKLQQLIGLSKEQFSQIVMLPQGEFRKLLTSDTENKEEILRKIFQTSFYRLVQERFAQKRKEAREALLRAQTEMELHMKQVSAVLPWRKDSPLFLELDLEHRSVRRTIEGLEKEHRYYAELASSLEIHREALKEKLQRAETDLQQAYMLNNRFTELEQKSAKLTNLETKLPEIKEKKNRLEKAIQASQLQPYEEQYLSAYQTEERRKLEANNARQELEAARMALDRAEDALKAEADKEKLREELAREVDRLKELQPIVEQLDQSQHEIIELRKKEEQVLSDLTRVDKQLASVKEKKSTCLQQLKQGEKARTALHDKRKNIDQMRLQVRMMKEALELQKQLQQQLEADQHHYKRLVTLRKQHDHMEAAWLEGQAAWLSEHLHDGKPCPVCGSTVHPNKAKPNPTMPSKAQLQQMKELLLQQEKEWQDAQIQVAATQSNIRHWKEELSHFGVHMDNLQQEYDRFVAEGKRLNSEIQVLEQQVQQLESLQDESEQLDKRLEQLLQDKERWSKKQQELRVDYVAKQSVLQQHMQRIPEGLRSIESLSKQLLEREQQLERLKQEWQRVRIMHQEAQKLFSAKESSAAHTQQLLKEAEAERDKAKQRFYDALSQSGFDNESAYRSAVMTVEKQNAWKQEIDVFQTTLATLREQVHELKQELVHRKPADIAALENKVTTLKQEWDLLLQQAGEAERYMQEAVRLADELKQQQENVKAIEQQVELLSDVYETMKGDNPLKLSFERYILIEFLEQILRAANVRLHRLSNGQFQLQRSDRMEKHNRQSGLGLDVYDAYTGMTRDVKTLSGGEKFNTSLSLALGMADVIQAHQGGVSIEMMFIDEGFGSLDEEALQKAVETLIDLQQTGRMIGVISHVQELKNTLPAALEVVKTKDGHSRASFVVR